MQHRCWCRSGRWSRGVRSGNFSFVFAIHFIYASILFLKCNTKISIHSVLEVDLRGQANAECIEGATFSVTGGLLDFVRGTFALRGGKSFHAFYSTAKSDTISRVVPHLASGSVVTTPRADTHYLITEQGIVNLKGKSNRERAVAIVSLAHPKFRNELMRQAEDMYLI